MRGKLTIVFCGGSLVAGLGGVSARAQEPITAFTNVSVIPMDRERVLAGQTVVVRGSRIASIGPAGSVLIPSGAVRVDGRGKFLIPGLGDMHVHLGWDRRPIADELFLYLANGVTTVRDMNSTPAQLELRARVAKGELLGPRIYAAAVTGTGGGSMGGGQSIADTVAQRRAAGYDLIKINDDNLDPETFERVVTAARRAGLPVAGHVPTPVGLERVLAAPYASIEHLTGYLPYLIGVGALPDVEDTLGPLAVAKLTAIAGRTARAGVWNCPTLIVMKNLVSDSRALTGRPEARYVDSTTVASWERWTSILKSASELRSDVKRRLALSPHLVRALRDAGAGLLLGTDAGAPRTVPGFMVHRELEALVATGLTPYQALATGTKNVAVFLGTADSTGTVESGKRADVVLLDGNPLRDIRHVAIPAGVMVGGRWLLRAELDAHLAQLERHEP